MGFIGAISALKVDCTLCVPKVYTDYTLVLPGCTLFVFQSDCRDSTFFQPTGI